MGGQTFEIDSAEGVVRVIGTGMWTPEDATGHFIAVEAALRPLRAAGKPLVFLLDMRDAVVQSQETAMAMRRGAMRMHRESDLIAAVTTSVLHAMQIKSAPRIGRVATFADMEAAVAWVEEQRVPA